MKIRIPLLIAVALSLSAIGVAASADQVYKWVDKDGHTHYSQTPPSSTDVNAQTVDITPPAPDPTTLRNEANLAKSLQDQDKQNQKTQEQAQKDAEQKAQKDKLCDDLRQRLQVMDQSARVATVDAQGNKTYISDDDRAKQEQQMQDQIAKSCGGGGA